MATITLHLIARLAALCDASGLTRSDIAGRAGMLPGDLSRLLSGRRDPALSSVARILEAIGEPWAALDDSTATN
jgi:transcriptional regulator with XRE-family HTH domain